MKVLFKLSLFLVVFLASLGQLVKVGSFYLWEVLLPFFVFFWFINLLVIKKKMQIPSYSIAMLLFVLYSLIPLLYSLNDLRPDQVISSSLYLVRLTLLIVVSIGVDNLIKTDFFSRRFLLKLLIFSSLVLSLLGFVQLVVLPDFGVLPAELGWDPHYKRLASTFFDPNFTGSYLVMGIVISLMMYYEHTRYSLIHLATSAVLILALILTFSRSSWLMFGIAVLCFAAFKSGKLLIVSLAILLLTYFLVPRVQTRLEGIADPSDSARLRLISWQNAISISRSHIFFGVGFNNYRYVQEELGYFDFRDPAGGHAGSGSDSSLLLVLATSGILGLLTFLVGPFLLLKNSVSGILRNEIYPLGLFVTLVSLAVQSNFVNSLFYPQYLLWLAILAPVCSWRKPTSS